MAVETIIRCKHNLEKDCCAICNGYVGRCESSLIANKEEAIRRKESIAKRKALLDYSRAMAYRHNAEYTDAELKHIIFNTLCIVKADFQSLYNLAIDLNRSLGAMEWIWNYIWKDEITDIFRDGMDNSLWVRIQNIKGQMFPNGGN